ncbi:ATP-binding protein [Gordonia pseudamarae]|uniref:Histidine kinase n=1 Tax=Gordonia pseudamarae TaxID=2831662 RepID=A0ABX6ILT1_9ACTN|nr:ATP-binding protein [Gordonia pseudamarae]QHN36864.1 histidine kinase [Gordonia pseudamarae]
MKTYSLEAGDDHVQKLAHENDPVKAVIELVWNSLDADAHRVDVILHRSQTDVVVGVEVNDDGHGMAPEEISAAFRFVGNSWKRTALRSRDESRPLHGKFGQGRLRAFALGTKVTWDTVGDSTDGKRLRSVVTARSGDRNHVEVSDAVETDADTGTKFAAEGKEAIDPLDKDAAAERLGTTLAPYLIAHDSVEVVYDGQRILPAENIARDTELPLEWEHGGTVRHAKLRVIEWKKPAGREIHLCDASSVVVDTLDSAPGPDFSYSAYLLWDEMPEHQGQWPLAKMESTPTVLGTTLAELDQVLADYLDARRDERRRELVDEWKTAKVYPYKGEPVSTEEEVERAAFDVVATSINRYIPKEGKRKQRLTLGLLKDSLQQRPGDVTELLDQYVGLPAEEREHLDRLLNSTGLSRVIRASTDVTNRLEFLAALQLMVFDPEKHKLVGEREHLHKILERELWVFGEQYNFMVSERGLTAALDRHRELLGMDRSDRTPVKRLDGSVGRLDLLLSAVATEHDRNRHLVVELKAPRVRAGQTELNQIESYAMAVASDARFADATTEWDFWLVTSEVDSVVRQKSNQRGWERGLAFAPDDLPEAPGATVRVWVRTWGQIIDEAKHRLDYFQKSLQHDPSLDEAKEYLRRQHSDVIPEGLIEDIDAPA